jgi:hypothetical protein
MPFRRRPLLKPDSSQADVRVTDLAPSEAKAVRLSPQEAQLALSVLEADQLVASKQRTRFGRRFLSLRVRLLLWGLRLYVIVMLLIVLIAVLRALHGGS